MKSRLLVLIFILLLSAAAILLLGKYEFRSSLTQAAAKCASTSSSPKKSSHNSNSLPLQSSSAFQDQVVHETKSNPTLRPDPTLNPTGTASDTVAVPHGAKLPSVMLDAGSDDDAPWVRESMAQMEADFVADFESAKKSGLSIPEAWDQARERADARYTAIFGQDAFLEASSVATDEANEELQTKK